MDGAQPFKALDELSCQGACSLTESCGHWSYWKPGRLCHLQGPGATRSSGGPPGFISGPPRCEGGAEPAGGGGATPSSGGGGANESLKRCVDFGAAYAPSLGNPRYFPRAASVAEHREYVIACMKFCANTTGCAHFTYDIVVGSCKLAPASATLSRDVPLTVSGPPRCPKGTGEDGSGAGAAPARLLPTARQGGAGAAPPARDLHLAAEAYGDLLEML